MQKEFNRLRPFGDNSPKRRLEMGLTTYGDKIIKANREKTKKLGDGIESPNANRAGYYGYTFKHMKKSALLTDQDLKLP